MKTNNFLNFELNTTVNLSPSEKRKINQWLKLSSEVIERFFLIKFSKLKMKKVHLSLLICGDKKIQSLNNNFRAKNKVTDVLSFPNFESLRSKGTNLQAFGEVLFLGDLAICYPQTKRQAKEFDITVLDEFIHLFFHGFLHLVGFDHEVSLKDEKLMQELEDWCLSEFSKIKKGS